MPRVRGRQRGELTRSFQFDGVAIGGHERGCGELKRSWPPAGVAIGGVWGVEVSRDGQQKAASGVGFVEDSGDRNNHHNIEFWGSRAPHMLEGREGLRLLRAATLNIE